MKKLIITITLCFIVFITNAQYISKLAAKGLNNGTNYSWDKPQATYLKVNIKGNYISISDESRSFYTVTELILDNTFKKESSWYALDERNKKCVIKFTTHDNENITLYVFYDNIAFCYILTKPIKLDNL